MIYKDGEKVKITGTAMYKELCEAFPEIEKKMPIVLELLESQKRSVETSDGQSIQVWPERVVTYQFEAMEGADKVVWRLQRSVPTKNKVTNEYDFKKVAASLTTSNNPTKVFITDPDSRNNNLDELFLLWHFYPQITNGKVGNPSGKYRFVNKEKDEQDALTAELLYSQTVVNLNTADMNTLVSLYEKIYETSCPSGVTKNSVAAQFINRIKADKRLLAKVADFFNGSSTKSIEGVVELVNAAISAGVLVTGEDGEGVWFVNGRGKEEIIAGKTTEDVDVIAEYVSKNNSLKASLKKLTK